ncbi:uncharacterized protein LOC117530424 [Thalassophryne amazonica]|uniref:uncharacterized protein LOC117530424 n=1 Tax=Thalassophryne amazonica TaxID=390379 RepID=UPI001470939D|nr:uncharacterized protein LOC117530424 [Thalassophryne amazonica]
MKKVLKNVLALVKEHPCGIPLEKIDLFYNMKYQKKLSLSSLGFTSMDGLVASLDELVVSGELVFYKAHLQGQGQDGASTEAGKNSKKSKKVLQNIVEIVKMHRNGIPLKKLAVIYNQNYHQNLTLASLGFNTITCLVESLDADLVVEGQQVFHKSHRPQNQHGAGTLPETPQTAESHIRNSDIIQSVPVSRVPMTFGCNPHTEIIFGAALSPASSLFSTSGLVGKPVMIPSQPAEKLTQGQLLERVTEVMKIYQPKTIQQLITDYAQQFGTELPLDQYMSLYDHWEAGKLDIQSGPVAKYGAAKHSKPVLSQTTPDAPKQHKDTDSDQTPDVQKTPEREQREQAGSIISELDFPALGSNIKSTREQTHKAPHKDGSLPVFRDAYHAQLRERHGDNVRAQEAAERDEKELGQRRHRNLNPDVVNSLAEDVIREIAAAGDNVTKEKVMSRVCTLLQISYQEADRLRFWKIQALKDLEYTMREINMFIQCTEAVMAICTLYELGQALAALKDKKRYEELNLGPLCKLPLIHRLFKIDGNTKDDDIHQIETVDILRQLQLFRQKNKGTVDLAEFMKHLADHYNCNSPYELGIRITSIGLAISSIGKVNRNQSTIMVQARDAIQKDLEEEIHERMRKLKKSVMEPLQGAAPFSASGSTAFRNSYISMTAAEVVLAVFTNAEGVFSPRMAKHVQNFLIQVSGDRLATALFQLAICGGSLDVPKDLVPKDKPSNNVQMTKNEAKPVTSLPSEAAVKQFLKENLSGHTSPITLGYIAVLERKLAKHFQVNNFISLQQGSFLEFLVKHIQLLQETVGFTLNLGSITEGSGFRPTRQDIFEFIKQCGDITSTDPDALFHIESALRSHYGVQDSRDLCLGSLRMLADLVRRQREMLAGAGISEVYYESALFANHSSPPVVKAQGACDTVGLLGEVSKVQALASLLSCPLLEDLSQWSQWDLIFKPCHGSLKDFIERNAANSGLAALEVSPGLLLRITTHTGDKPFSCAAMNLDPIGTAGHLCVHGGN